MGAWRTREVPHPRSGLLIAVPEGHPAGLHPACPRKTRQPREGAQTRPWGRSAQLFHQTCPTST